MIEGPPIRANGKAVAQVLLTLLVLVVTLLAKGLQSTIHELEPITTMGLDVVGHCGSHHLPLAQVHGAQGVGCKVPCPTALPYVEPVPAAPRAGLCESQGRHVFGCPAGGRLLGERRPEKGSPVFHRTLLEDGSMMSAVPGAALFSRTSAARMLAQHAGRVSQLDQDMLADSGEARKTRCATRSLGF